MAPPPRSALNRRLHGTIAYRTADGAAVGHEHFDLSSHADGHVLRALCVLDDVGLIRDVTLAMDQAWRPLDGYCRLIRNGAHEAALWFFVEDTGVVVEASHGGQRLPQAFVPTTARLPYLGLHPVQGDALIVEQRGTDRPGVFDAVETVTNSISPNGDEAVGAHHMTIDVAYIGEEEISVAAGTFAARRYALRWRADWPAADVWVRAEDNLFLLMRWSMIETWYELLDWHDDRFMEEHLMKDSAR